MFAVWLRLLVGLSVALGLGLVPAVAAPVSPVGSTSSVVQERGSSQVGSVPRHLTTVCVAKRSKRLSSPKSERCGKGRTLLRLKVTNRRTACLTPTSVRAVDGPACRQVGGVIRRLPSKRTVTLCALGRSGDLRRVKRAKACTKRERVVLIGNRTPSNIRVTDLRLVENVKPGSVIGALTSDDPDSGDYARYRLVPGAGGDDNRSFSLDGAVLSTVGAIDFEAKSTYRIRVRARDVLGRSLTSALNLAVTDEDENNAPGAIALTPSTVAENQEADALVGLLTTTDADPGDTHTYTLLSEAPFAIRGVEVRTTRRLDHEQKASYSLDIRSTDRAGESVTATVVVTVGNLNEPATTIALSASEIAENNPVDAVVGTLSDDDPEGGTTYSLAPGAGDDDNAAFAVDGDQVRAKHSFDFESKHSYAIRVLADDGQGGRLEQAFVVSVIDVNEQPSDISLTPSSIAENNAQDAAIGSLSALDPDAGDDVTFELAAGGADNAEVEIVDDTLHAVNSLDHETQGVLAVRVRAVDSSGASAVEDLTVTVTDVNEAATSISLSDSEIAENNDVGDIVGTLSDNDPEGNTTYSLVSGAGSGDNGEFAISAGQLTAGSVFDFESKSSYSVRVQASDGAGGTYAQALIVTVADVNESPTDVTLAPASIAENNAPGAVVGTLTGVDPDAGGNHTFTLVNDGVPNDNAAFAVDGDQLRVQGSLDYETDPSLEIRIRVTDAGGESHTETLTVTVTDLNEAATYISLSSSEIDENNAANAVVGTLSDDDPEGGTTYVLVSGDGDDDNAAFDIVGDEVRARTPFDFESKDSYRIRVLADDGDGGTFAQTMYIQVRDVNEAPTAVALDATTIPETAGVGSRVGGLSTTDPDAGESFTYELVTGDTYFEIVGDELRTAVELNAQSTPTIGISVRSTDSGGLTRTVPFTITVDDVNEAPDSLTLTGATIQENAGDALVGILSSTDPDGTSSFTYTFASAAGHDNDEFVISGNELRTKQAGLDFETAPTRSVRIRVTDVGGLWFEKDFEITVTDVNESPTTPSPATAAIDENVAIGTSVVTFASTDPEQATLTYSLVSGDGDDDNGLFLLSAAGELTTAQSLDHEAHDPATIRVQVSDGPNTSVREVTVTINDLNEVSTAIALDPDHIAENKPAGTMVGTLAGNDPDAGDTLSYELVSGDGANDRDNASFEIDGDDLLAVASLDREAATQPLHIRVRVTDSQGETFDEDLTVTVDNVNESPSALTWADGTTTARDVDENKPSGTVVGSVLGTDPDVGDTLTYSLVGGDTSRFSVNATSGELRTVGSFDYEAIAGHAFTVTLRVTDAGGLLREQALTIDVNDVNDAPSVSNDTFTGAIGNTQAKAGTASTTGPTVTLTGALPLANDSDQDAGDSISVVPANAASTTGGGQITITANGHFVYLPPVGARSVDDTFTYTVTDTRGATATGTITITIGSRTIWYVNASATAGGDGRSTAPLQSPAPLDGATGADQAGDQIYLFEGTYSAGIQLLTNQRLTGAGSPLTGLLPAGVTPTIEVTSGKAVGLGTGSTVEGVNLTASSTAVALRADTIDSATVAASVVILGGSQDAVFITGGGGAIVIDAPITSGSGRALHVSNRTSGSVRFTGQITKTGATEGVNLASNAGSISFTGGLNLSSGPARAFEATNSGTLTVIGDGNKLTTTTGTALNVTGTTISANGLTFESISSAGAASGIVLSNTGTTGSLTVTGTTTGDCKTSGSAATCTGGSIMGSTGSGISLTNTQAPSFNRVRVVGSAVHGITASGVTSGLRVTNGHLADNGNANDEYGIGLVNPAGDVVVDNTAVTGSGDVNVHLGASAGTSTLTLTNSRITNAGAGTSAPLGGTGSIRDGLLARVGGTASAKLVVGDNTFSGNLGDHVQVASSGGTVASGSVIRGNTLTGGTLGALGQGIVVNSAAASWTGTVKMLIDGNTITGSRASAVSVSQAGASGAASFHAQVSNNVIGSASATCSQTANGITVGNDVSSTAIVVNIVNNTITNCADRGISMTVGDGASSVQGTITGNTVSGLPASARQGLEANIGTTSADTGTSCLAISGNTLTGATGYAGLRIRHRFATLQLPSYAGGATDAAAVQAYLASRNAGTAVVEVPNNGAFANSTGCTTPVL